MKFHLGTVLSITTGRLLSPDGIDGVYKILDYMTGDSLFTHQLPRVSRECKPFLIEQYPYLANVDASNVELNNWEAWLHEKVREHGEYLEVALIPKESHVQKDPVQEAIEIMGPKKVIVVESPE